MLEAKKCARCGVMYISESDVCGKCQQKDGADMNKLKGYLERELGSIDSTVNLSQATGISPKNLERYLGYDEFKGIELGNAIVADGIVDGNIGDVIVV